MEIEQVVQYVMHSPENTNPAVLRSMLSDIGGGEEEIFYIETIKVEETGDWLIDKNYEEILRAAEAKKICIVNSEDESFSGYENLYLNSINTSDEEMIFVGVKWNNSSLEGTAYIFTITKDGITDLKSTDFNISR